MFKTDISYQAVMFCNAERIMPSKEVVSLLVKEYADFGLLPGGIQVVAKERGGAAPRLSLNNSERKVSVLIFPSRIDIIRHVGLVGEDYYSNLSDFLAFAKEIFAKLCIDFKLKGSRMSLVASHLTESMAWGELDALQDRFLIKNFDVISGDMPEWSTRSVLRGQIGACGEECNVVTNVARIEATIQSDGVEEQYSGIQFDVDVNTVSTNSDTRFVSSNINAFFDDAFSLHSQLVARLRGVIYGE